MTWRVPLFKILSDEADVKAVSQIIKSGLNWATGSEVADFEKELAKYVGVKYAAAFNSGTSALHALLLALHIGKGDEVIVPSFTFIATANAVLFVGAKPVFAEIEGETYGLDPKDVEKKITKRTKAIMPVHFGGGACKYILELRKLAKKHKLLLLEDAAESLGATVGGKYVGSFGYAAMISLCAPKVISTGEGGVIVTNSRDLYEKLKLLRSHGRADTKDYFATTEYLDYIQLGYNFRLSNILAALGRTQLEKIEKLIAMRRKNSAYLTKQLKGVPGISLPIEPKGYRHIYQMYTIQTKNKKVRDALQKHLNQKGIMAKVYFPSIHLSKFYRKMGHKSGSLPKTEGLSNIVLTLPMYPELTKSQMDFMAKEIKSFFNGQE
ncbi:MAG: DegT/DnrJ/EryC1/StrS family aminotransferase [Candidatus Colwellbacteria bacterium]|nr:DegT/DnrJ/EryC1/StrS family aminotransferase [Candidatus Colwellbacteria bacterium]